MVSKPTVISLFAGCGGSSLGYKWAGFKELLAIDFDQNAVDTFRLNFPEVPCWQRDIREVMGQEILDFCKIKKGELDLLDASPPCQGFSTAGKRKVTDPRNDLFREFVRLIKELGPKVFVMENVSGLVKGPMRGIFNDILRELRGCGYQVKCKLMNAKWYGVPQSRPRIIFIGIRDDLDGEITFPIQKNIIPLRDVLKDVPISESVYPQGKAAIYAARIKPWKDGGDVTGREFGRETFFNLKRLAWNYPARTITKTIRPAQCGLLHPDENRFLTIMELKRISTFPDEFQFLGTFRDQWARIGNAVMPKFMEAIASHVKATLLDEASIRKTREKANG